MENSSDDIIGIIFGSKIDTETLILMNLLPLAGVLFFGWEVGAIMLIYWLENGVIGGFNILKMYFASKGEGSLAAAIFLSLFFSFHYGMFWLVHGVFVIVIFVLSEVDVILADAGFITLALLGTVVSHGVSFYTNYYRPESYKNKRPQELMKEPYTRVVILHIVILFGGFLVMSFNSPILALVLLVLLKIVIDTALHLKVDVGDSGSELTN